MRTPHVFAFALAVVLAVTTILVAPTRAAAQTASQFYSEGIAAYQQGDMAGAKQKLRLALEVDKNFRPASALLNRIALEEKQAGTQPTGVPVKTLEKMPISVEFKDTTLPSALEYIRQRVESDSGGKVQINFVTKLPPEFANKKVTVKLDRVPVMETLRYLGNLAGVVFQVEQYAIVVVPAGSAAPTANTPVATP